MVGAMTTYVPPENQFQCQAFMAPVFLSGELFPAESTTIPALSCSSCPLNIEVATLRCEKAYWQKMHQKALVREAELKKELDEANAKLRLREQQLFGRKSEKISGKNESSKQCVTKNNRGQQKGSKGHGRRDYSHLPAEEECIVIPPDERCCPVCHLPFQAFPGTEDSEIIEIHVKAHRRIIKRTIYKRGCTCDALPGIITAPPAPKLIPKGIFGTSVWVTILLDKFCFLRPTHRLLDDLKTHGLDLALGTLTGGLKALAPLFLPIQNAIIEKNRSEDRWHADETRWRVFTSIEGKVGFQWYMWVFSSPSTVVYTLDPSRSAKVPLAHFEGVTEGILSVDRYSAYKAMVKTIMLILAFCWAHVRRDFLRVANNWPELESWAFEWVEDIGELYHLNHLRLEVLDQPEFAQKDLLLRDAIDKMNDKCDAQLKEENIPEPKEKTLKSLKEHWPGLKVFVDHPEVPMDNNMAERLERTPVIARNNFNGSFAVWAGNFAAMMFGIFKTLQLWQLNPRSWLTAYLEVCAANRGCPPENIRHFLPWNMSADQLKTFSQKWNDSS